MFRYGASFAPLNVVWVLLVCFQELVCHLPKRPKKLKYLSSLLQSVFFFPLKAKSTAKSRF